MTLILELKPEVEARISAQAAEQGVPVEVYIQGVLESFAVGQEEPLFDALPPEQRARAWQEWVMSHDDITGPRSLDDSRESIYREREESQL